MRPVDRGISPRLYADYRHAAVDLYDRLGDYCSYCERQIETYLAVEHIQPKTHVPELRNEWSNFLLGCVNCNSSKGSLEINLEDYLWPDCDNTMRGLDYLRGGLVQPNPDQPQPVQVKAKATIILVGLDKDPGNPDRTRRPTSSDTRWLRRQQAWQLAEKDLQRLLRNDCLEVRELIVENALGRGMFSIWWTVFSGDRDMRRRLREAFRGTAMDCFDADEDLLERSGGQV